MMSYTIQCTITKLSSDGSVVVKGCEGFFLKKDGTEYNVFVDGMNARLQKSLLKLGKKNNWGEWEFALLRDAVSNNKKVELLVSDDLKIESVSIIA